MFTQGAFMSSAQDTDMAIAGDGFFSVRNMITGDINYTRAGIYTLNKDGYVEDPNRNVLQGWKLSLPKPGELPVKIGAPTDVKLAVLNAPPASTSTIKIATNLNADAEPSWQYREHQLTFDYADEIARAYAAKARDAAIFDIWNEFCLKITEPNPAWIDAVFVPDPDNFDVTARTFHFSQVVTAANATSAHPLTYIGSAGAYAPGTDSVEAVVWFTKQIFFNDPVGVRHSANIYYSARVTFNVIPGTPPDPSSGYTVTSAILTDPVYSIAAGGTSSVTVAFGLDNIDTSQGGGILPPAITIPANTTTSVLIYFTSSVTTTNSDGIAIVNTVVTSAWVEFKGQNYIYTIGTLADLKSKLVDPVWVSAYTSAGTPVTGALPESPATFLELTSAISQAFSSTIADWQDLEKINYRYYTGKTAMLPHMESYSDTAVFTTRPGIQVPGGVPGTTTPIKVWFTKDILIPNPSIPPDGLIEKAILISAVIDFPVREYSYVSANVIANITIPDIPFTYTSALTGNFERQNVPVPITLSNIDFDRTSAGNVPTAGGWPLIISSANGANPTQEVKVFFTSVVILADQYGNLLQSAITTSALVRFNTLASADGVAYDIVSAGHLLALLSDSTYVTSYMPEGVNALIPGAIPANGTFAAVYRDISIPYPYGAYFISAQGLYSPPNPTLLTYNAEINIPAADPTGAPPTYSGDIYYRNVVFYSAVSFFDANGNLRVERIAKSIPVPFVLRMSAYTSANITSPPTTFTIPYSVVSRTTVGGSLVTAYYNSARVDFTPDPSGIYDRNFLNAYLDYAIGNFSNEAVEWLRDQIRVNPVSALNALVVVNDTGLDWPPVAADRMLLTGLDLPEPKYLFRIGHGEVSQLNITASGRTWLDAVQRGDTVYSTVYNDIFRAEGNIIEAYLPEWKLGGMGFAAAWDARDPNGEYIDSPGMHVDPIIIYDSLGSQHQLMIYYQKNPHMDNVWDYIITCDPLEDARKDQNNITLLTEQASFSGLIQKGKITFTGDGNDRHGGVIKDLEAQNIDFSQSRMARIGTQEPMGSGFDNSYTWQNATIGGYFTGSPKIDPLTGNYMAENRTYEVLWGGVDEKRLAADEKSWLDAFNLYMEYLHDTGSSAWTKYELYATKVFPEDKVIPNEDNSPTWQERFIADWEVWRNSAPTDPARPPQALLNRIQTLLPYGSNNSSLYGPTGAQRPDVLDKNPATQGRTSKYWNNYVNDSPRTDGFTVIDTSTGERQIVNVVDKNSMGPYHFGSGLTITFAKKDTPLKFGEPGQDGFRIGATSEQLVWENLTPNHQGVFDFDVAFVTSASMALHPPYPEGMPSIYQHISFDMGARNPDGLSPAWKVDKEMSTTQYAASNRNDNNVGSTLFKGQDGHAAGSLARISISEDGILTGIFTNGYQMELYQIGLTRFLNPWGLTKLGDNLFAETRYSGAGVMNEPGKAGTGKILSNFLEQSNVDVAEEIVDMILTQRGYQANTKTVTTVDSMLHEVIEMKR
jgi:flagellar hook-basal body protein